MSTAPIGSREWFRNASKEEVQALPWDHPGVVVVPGRYYYGQVNLFIPPTELTPRGCDIMGCLWRFDANPAEWYFTCRLRIYLDDKVSDSADFKSWRVEKIPAATEAEAVAAMHQLGILADFPKEDSELIKWIIVQGDSEKFGNAMTEAAKTATYLHKETVTKAEGVK